MKKYFGLILGASLVLASCSSDDDGTGGGPDTIDEPALYTFTRDGQSTVSFGGQTTRIKMGQEMLTALKDFDNMTEADLLNMFANENDPFSEADLNGSGKSIKTKTAESEDFFSSNSAASALIQAEFESWLSAQVSEVKPNVMTAAAEGTAGQIADGSSTRYVNAKGLEYNQAFNKSLIGALMTDQALNNYLGTAVLDAGSNRTDNDAGTVAEGKTYTTMEHKWDEAYGYLYGLSQDAADPNATIGDDDSFLNKYIGRVEGDADFAGIAADIFNAFKKGRTAIVNKQYDVRDAQAQIIREKVSLVIAVRAIYYLQGGKSALEASPVAYGTAFHDLSEGFGFVYSLQFTRKPGTNDPYFTKAEVDAYIAQLTAGNGFWDVSGSTLDTMSNQIASRFGITVAQAAN